MFRAFSSVILSLGALSASAFAAEPPVRFSRDVLPILASKCFTCHGPDAQQRKAGLRLDQKDGLFAPLKSGDVAVVPGDTAKSVLALRIASTDPDMQMPPPDAPKSLTDAEKETLARWIAEGAPWTGHWAFEPLQESTPPVTAGDTWSRNPIDQFIRVAQIDKGLAPSPEADRRTLIRRLSFDLLGLPPTPDAVDAFVNDARPNAYEQLVDSMLASPRYGERWARHWLDVVHYADTHGYDKDKRRENAWPYRDYVINALNADKPYGRFIQEQIAGDALFPDDPQATVALGFLSAGPWDFVGHMELREGTIDKAITRNLDRDDIVSTTMAALTSLTAGCARCHDHKFDPISQEDYYSLQAVFAGIDRADREYDDDPAIHQKRQQLIHERDRLFRENDTFKQRLKDVKSPVLDTVQEALKPVEAHLSILSRKESPTNGYHSTIENAPESVKWVQVDLGTSQQLEKVRLIPARPIDFTDTPGFGFPLRFKIEVSDDPQFTAPSVVADYTKMDHGFRTDQAVEIAANGASGRYVRFTATRLWKRLEDFAFALAEMEIYSNGANVARGKTVSALDSIESGRWGMAHLVDGFDSHQRLGEAGTDANTAASIAMLEKLAGSLKAERDAITLSYLPETDQTRYGALQEEIARANEAWSKLPAPHKVYAATGHFARNEKDTPPEAIRSIHLLIRGSEKNPGPEVVPGTVSCIPDLESRFKDAAMGDESGRRATLAHWITDERNPLPWRSIVNRVWHYHFGQGIVSTPNDFGRMGAPPTHPELLDWLASEFLKNGQSLKWLHRLIVTSATYRQSSESNPSFQSIDGSNQYLWRMNRRQLEAEALHDATLATSGKLDLTMGGPGVNLFVFEDDHSPRYKYAEFNAADPAGFRRSIYRFIVRSVPDPFMTNMDCADPSQSVPVRNQTLTAIQALSMLNNPMTVRQAAYFAERVAGEAATIPAQVEDAYRIALNRSPSDEERSALVPYAEKNGMAAACRLILNSNEFMFVD